MKGAELEARLGYSFVDGALLALALVHRSSLSTPGANNEKLEFLGDAVLDLAVSDLLMERFSRADEGQLSKLRAALVNTRMLARKASELELGVMLELGRGEERSGGRLKTSILAAAFEAILGAVYKDGGFAPARAVVGRLFADDLERTTLESEVDYKSRLQELTQRLFREAPVYTLVEASGPDHDKAFVAEIHIAGHLHGRGSGKSKKAAEQAAALEALSHLSPEGRSS